MKLVLLYGPPAVGKYTVGASLAEQTGYKLVHNHVTVDVAKLIFDKKDDHTRPFIAELREALRLDIVRVAAKAGVNNIMTLAYTVGESDDFVRSVIKTVTEAGGEVCLVRLTAPAQILYDRVGNDSRKELHKPTDAEALRQKMEKGALDKPIPFAKSFEIDTTKHTAQEAAATIIKHFDL